MVLMMTVVVYEQGSWPRGCGGYQADNDDGDNDDKVNDKDEDKACMTDLMGASSAVHRGHWLPGVSFWAEPLTSGWEKKS